MKMRVFCLLFSLFFCFNLSAQSQELPRIEGDILVQFLPHIDVEQWLADRNNARLAAPLISYHRSLGQRHNIHQFRFSEEQQSAADLLQWFRQEEGVERVQFNYQVNFRGLPNDSDYFRQWDMEIIDAPTAWDKSTGGYTTSGTPIVVAIMDSGFDPSHEDLIENLWHNPAEILGDGIDNDNNGYVDDDIGWDYFSDSPNIAPGYHGLSSAAIVGAKGNNNQGVTGLNWDVDLMLFSFNSVADLVLAYEYVIDQRMRFNASNGAEGAFVVATNNSFGQDRIKCTQQPIWGAMFDLLGEVGILSSSGVSNIRFNVDNAGDMPANCPSDYLLISCNTDEDDNLYDDSAYGPISVDIGSPGEGSITAKPGNSYGAVGGNSAATPHVTGAIALLYSGPCAGLEADAINHPSSTALFIKNLLMTSGDLLPSLTNRTLTGRRLNVGNAMTALTESCNNVLEPLAIKKVFPNPVRTLLTVNYGSPENGDLQAELYNTLGQLVLHDDITVGEIGLRTFTLDVSRLAAGIYFLRFGKGEQWVSQKIVVD